MKPLCSFSLFLASLFFVASTRAETITLPVARDLWISSASGEEEGNNGGSPRLKLKGYQEFSILDFDVAPLRGKIIKKATLRLKLSSDERLYRVAVGTLAADWVEGSSANYEKESGASSFRWRIAPDVPWFDANVGQDDAPKPTSKYSDMTSVIFGEGGSIWATAEASEPQDGWQSIKVAPEVVSSRVAGVSRGFVLFDDTGTEVERDGNDAKIRLFPNRFFYSREQNASCAPRLEVECEDVSSFARPTAPRRLSAVSDLSLPRGTVVLSWEHARLISDNIVGFFVKLDGKEVPQTLIPAPCLGASSFKPTEERRFNARLEGLTPDVSHTFEVVAVDRLGVKSQVATKKFQTSDSDFEDWNALLGLNKNARRATPTKKSQSLPQLGASSVCVLPEFVKTLSSGETIPMTTRDYRASNALWNGSERLVDLTSAQNEFVGFQIAFEGAAQKVRFNLSWDETTSNDPRAAFYRLARVETPKGLVGDPALPVDSSSAIALNEGGDSVCCELFVPNAAAPGVRTGLLTITNDSKESIQLKIRLKIWNFALPNELNFLPEMNCYSLPENEREYYRLAQLHRTYINRVPYSHRGTVGDGLAPRWDVKSQTFDWRDWEKRFGAYFDGSAFADLPRGAVPIEAFYLPLFENFPADIFSGYDENKSYPDDSSFSSEYRAAFRAGCVGFGKEIVARKWDKTRFLFFLNNKSDYKKDGWFRASSPWLLDEPASFRDFAALAYFGRNLKESLQENGLENVLQYRADISRPQWERDSLAPWLDVYVVGGEAFRRYNRLVCERRDAFGRLVYTYGTTAPPESSAFQPVLWSLDAWSLGAQGVVPWQTIGTRESWRVGDELALFYPACQESAGRVVASLRLKAYRRGEQDVEYLTLLLARLGRSRNELAVALRRRLALDGSNLSASSEDAGTSVYNDVSPDELEYFRREIGEFLDAAKE